MATDGAIKDILNDWLGEKHPYEILQHWHTTDNLHYIVCTHRGRIYFIRIFSLGGKMVLSQDKCIRLDDIAPCRCAER